MMAEPVPMAEQVRCIERELRMRYRVYPRRIASGAMSREDAAREIRAMEAVLASLRTLPGSFAQEALF